MDRSAVNVLSLCTGIGGLDRGVRMAIPHARTVCAVEVEAYCCEVLAARMEEGNLDAAPVWTDLRTFDGRPWRGVVDLVVGGYPCQPFSFAGARLGADDPRHLWPHVARILRECRPAAGFFENVRGHVSLGLREVRCELEDMGYSVEAEVCAASEVGAPHQRERIFILAHTDEARSWMRVADADGPGVADAHESGWRERSSRSRTADAGGGGSVLADAAQLGERKQDDATRADARQLARSDARRRGGGMDWPPGPHESTRWAEWNGPQPAIRRDADGAANWMDRLRALGGAVVDRQAAFALELMRERVMTKAKKAA